MDHGLEGVHRMSDTSLATSLIARLVAADAGDPVLDRDIRAIFGIVDAAYTTSFEAAFSLLPTTVTNFHLFSFGGSGRYESDDLRGGSWGCKVHDRDQLVGSERAKHSVKRLQIPFALDGALNVTLERAIAEHFCEFSVTRAATPCLVICIIALKVRIGQTTDDDIWP
jgi:hypothetical protein